MILVFGLILRVYVIVSVFSADYILNTHHHWDHTGGNNEIKAATHCKVIGPGHDSQIDGKSASPSSDRGSIQPSSIFSSV